MKNFLIYLAGLVSGVILTVAVALIINASSTNASNDGLTMFEERGQMMQERSFKIFQTLGANHALANGISNEELGWHHGITVMVIGDEDTHFYDDQIIKTTSSKRFYQVGTYQYQTKSEDWKTVPVVMLLDKK